MNQLASRAFLTALFIFLLVVYSGIAVYLYLYTPVGPAVAQGVQRVLNRNESANSSTGSPASGSTQAEPAPTPPKDQPYTVLLLGYGGPGHEGPYLTDSIILAVVDPKAKSLTLLSIPRDTQVNLPLDQEDGIWSKINTAYSYGRVQSVYTQRPERYKGPKAGGILAKDTVENVTGVPIRYYLALDFVTFEKLIDEIGGIDITVQSAFTSYYPRIEDQNTDPDWMVVSFAAGKQHMSGGRALEYARAREAIDNPAEGSDFARSRRQQQIIQAFMDKMFTPGGLTHIPGLLNIAKKGIDTDLEIPGIADIQQLLTDWRGLKIAETALTGDNYLTSDGSNEKGYYLTPVAGWDNWSQIHAFVQVLISDPLLAQKMASTKVVIRNASGRGIKGKELQTKLMDQGFAIAPVQTVPVEPTTRIADMTNGNASNLIEALKTALDNPDIPVQQTKSSTPQVIIVLGKD